MSSVSHGSTAAEMTGSPACPVPVDGSSQSWNPLLITSRPPSTTDPTARTIIGTVISGGDSCGWASSGQRRRPRNVMK